MLGSSIREWEELRLTPWMDSLLMSVGVLGLSSSDDRLILVDLGDSAKGGLGAGFAGFIESVSCIGEAVSETADSGPIMLTDVALTSTVRNGGVGLRAEVGL